MDRRKSIKALAIGTISTGVFVEACKTKKEEKHHKYIEAIEKYLVSPTPEPPENLLIAAVIVKRPDLVIALLEEGRLVSIGSPQEFLNSSDPLVQKYVQAFSAAEQARGGK